MPAPLDGYSHLGSHTHTHPLPQHTKGKERKKKSDANQQDPPATENKEIRKGYPSIPFHSIPPTHMSTVDPANIQLRSLGATPLLPAASP
jgi:hypothetical protein